MVPARHGETAWKRWIFCPTDHLDFENLENRRRYHNPGKPRTAGLCGREVVASDHLPLSSTFFGRLKTPDLTHKTVAVVPFPMLFSFWRYPRKTTSPTFAYTGPTRPAASSVSPVAAPSAKVPHSPSQAATIARFAPNLGPCQSASPRFLFPGDSLLYLQRYPGSPDPAFGIVCTALLEIAYCLCYNTNPVRKIGLMGYPISVMPAPAGMTSFAAGRG